MSETDSLVSRVNPSIKLFLHLIAMLLLIVAKDPVTTLYLLAIPVLLSLTVARIPLKRFLVRIAPFLVLLATTTWMLAAYGKGTTVVYELGWFRFTEEGLSNGLNIGFRTMAFVSYGLLFTETTDVTKLVLSLMQQCKLPPKIAYAMLAAFRFLPMFKEEYEQVKAAHRVRGVARVPGIRGKVQAVLRYTVPLLAQGIRKAERVAVALEARGFDGSWNRTFYRTVPITWRDGVYLVILAVLHVGVWMLVK